MWLSIRSSGWCQINDGRLPGGGGGEATTKITPPSTLFTGYTLAITGQTPSFLNGTYIASCSSFRDANWYPYFAFNGIIVEGNAWIPSATYSSTTGLYTGATSTTVSGSSILGEWLQLQIPNDKIMSSYSICKDVLYNCSVLQWKLVGSNDGTTWSLIDSQDFTSTPTYWSGKTLATFNVSTVSYAYYRLIPQAVTKGGSYNVVKIGQFNISVFTTNPIVTPTITGTSSLSSNGSYANIYSFTSGSGTISFPSAKTVSILIVGGGGGGGFANTSSYDAGAGGGAGGVGIGTLSLSAGVTYSFTVGAGGSNGVATSSSSYSFAQNGSQSSFTGTGISEIAYGGGAGASQVVNNPNLTNNGSNGGSGGGACFGWAGAGQGIPGTATKGAGTTTYYGNSGGGLSGASGYTAGGGGGGSAVGTTNTLTSLLGGGNGGNGYTWAVNTSIYGGGGSGGAPGSSNNGGTSSGTPGTGGGGKGGYLNTPAVAGTVNTGGGGGGAYGGNNAIYNGGAGGSGIIIIAYN